MGFLEGLVKNAARKIMDEVVDNVMDDVIGNIRGKNGTELPNDSTVANTVSENVSAKVETVQFQPVSMSDVRDREYDFWWEDEEGKDVEVICQFKLPRDFVDYGNTHAAEIDCLFAYSPDDVEEDYVEDIHGKPYIYFGREDDLARPLDYYFSKGTVRDGEKVTKIEGSFVLYKTEKTRNDEYMITYHYYRRYESDLMYQIVLSIPKKFVGTDFGKEMEKVLDLVVSTYSDYVKKSNV